MANCTNCGKPLKEGVKFCTSCGAAVKSGASTKSAAPAKTAKAAKSTTAAKSETAATAVAQDAAPDVVTYAATDNVISTAGWFGTLIVLIVPIVGLVIYFVWAFGSGNLNRRNYCRASLIMMAVSIVLGIIISLTFYSFLSSVFGYF